MTPPSVPEHEHLRLSRWGLRFDDAATERAYREWLSRQAVPFTRVALVMSLVVWGLALAVTWFAAPERAGTLAAVVLGAIVPGVAAGLWVTTRPRLLPWVLPVSAVSNAVAGLLAVGLSVYLVDHPAFATVGAVIVVFFAMTIMRLHPSQALLASLTYVVLHQVLLGREFAAGRLGGADVTLYSFGAWSALLSGLALCLVITRISRETFRQGRVIELQQQAIERERARADELLHSILPRKIAERLKRGPEVIADRHDEVTVLFADVVGFTPLAARLPPERLVEVLNEVFTAFDALAARHGVEKIKTIGDAYMAVAGLPEPRGDHAQAMAAMALAMREAIGGLSAKYGEDIRLRIGLCTGPVVAGVIGSRKFAYDLWGDTVNTAARMEAHGVAGQIQLTGTTYEHLREKFVLADRGVVEVKGKGPMRTWLLERAR